MRTTVAVIPGILDVLTLIVLAVSLFLLIPLGKTFITQKLVEPEHQAIPAQRPQVSSVTSKITYYPDGTKSYEFIFGESISLLGTFSAEAVYYSIIYKIIEVYKYMEMLQSVLFLTWVYLFVRIIWICAMRPRSTISLLRILSQNRLEE